MFHTKAKVLQRLLQYRSCFCAAPTFGKASCSRLVLGIETSCDDTGAAVLDETGSVLGESLHSQKEVHLRWVSALFVNHDVYLLGFCSYLLNALGLVASSPQWHNSSTEKT